MRIGILGAGMIGKQLALKLATASHDVLIANTRGPETIAKDVLSTGAKAVTSKQAVSGREVVIISIPMERIPDIASLFSDVPKDVVVIDTSNYWPYRTGIIDAIESGQVESEWVTEQLGRPVVKAWNAIYFYSLENKGRPAGDPERLAIPVAADNERDRRIAMSLVEDTGFDAVDAGNIADSWRQQPAAPAYCTDLTRKEIIPALQAAERTRLPIRRELFWSVMKERTSSQTPTDPDYPVRLGRLIQM